MSGQNGVGVSWTRAAGSALGAVSSAVLLSTLGVGGTLIGAALGSLVITVGGAIYANSLQATKEKVFRTTSGTDQPSTRARGNAGLAVEAGVRAQQHTSASPAQEKDPRPARLWGQVLRDLPWKHIAGVTVALFAVAMALILTFELATGRAVSSYTGGSSSTNTGTSIPGFDGRGGSGTDTEQDPEQEGEVPQEDPTPPDPQQQDQQAPPEAPPADPEQQQENPER